MIRRNNTQRQPKTTKASKNQDASCSRIGSEYQAVVPDFVYAPNIPYQSSASNLEINVWRPSMAPISSVLEGFFQEASKNRFSKEAVHVFLHCHNYDISRTLTDLPNYHPLLNTWNKHEVQRFLKCVDSKPRKNFVNVKRSFPAYRMAEVADLYYGIAAPFKAISKHNKKHAQQMQTCFEKAVKRGFVSPSVRRTVPPGNLPQPSPEAPDDPFESELEHHLVGMLGEEQAKRLLSGVKRGRPPSLFSRKNLLFSDMMWSHSNNHNNQTKAGNSNGTDGQPPSSDYSSVCDGDRAPPSRTSRFNLPSGIHYDHEEFLKFLVTPLSELEENRLTEMAKLRPLDKELQSAIQAVDLKGQTVLDGLENYLPQGGFPKVAYRWTKMELALFLTALSKLGDDFAAISRTLGTKSESFIRDFYEEFKEKVGLDCLVKQRLKPEPAEAKAAQKIEQRRSPEPSRKEPERLGVDGMTELQLLDMSALPRPEGGVPALATAAKPEEKAVSDAESRDFPTVPAVQKTKSPETSPPTVLLAAAAVAAAGAPKKAEMEKEVEEAKDETSLENVVRAKNTPLAGESTPLRLLAPPQRGKRGRPRKHPIREEQQRQLTNEHAPAKRQRTSSPTGGARNVVGRPVQKRGKRGRPPLRRV